MTIFSIRGTLPLRRQAGRSGAVQTRAATETGERIRHFESAFAGHSEEESCGIAEIF